jgi:hypothetical protein
MQRRPEIIWPSLLRSMTHTATHFGKVTHLSHNFRPIVYADQPALAVHLDQTPQCQKLSQVVQPRTRYPKAGPLSRHRFLEGENVPTADPQIACVTATPCVLQFRRRGKAEAAAILGCRSPQVRVDLRCNLSRWLCGPRVFQMSQIGGSRSAFLDCLASRRSNELR